MALKGGSRFRNSEKPFTVPEFDCYAERLRIDWAFLPYRLVIGSAMIDWVCDGYSAGSTHPKYYPFCSNELELGSNWRPPVITLASLG